MEKTQCPGDVLTRFSSNGRDAEGITIDANVGEKTGYRGGAIQLRQAAAHL
jgi:hypothetical protein